MIIKLCAHGTDTTSKETMPNDIPDTHVRRRVNNHDAAWVVPAIPSLGRSGLSRRATLGAAVWSAPAVVAVIAAPAVAASETPPPPQEVVFDATLLVETFRSNRTDDGKGTRNGIKTGVQVRNEQHHGTDYQTVSQPVHEVSVAVTYAAEAKVDGVPTSYTGAGWSFKSVVKNNDQSTTYTFVFTGILGPSKNTGELEFTVAGTPPTTSIRQSMIAWAPNALPVAGPPWASTIY